MENSTAILVIGLHNMATLLGVSRCKVREYLKRRDFPARKEDSGSWVSTRQALAAWADSYVNSPDRPAF